MARSTEARSPALARVVDEDASIGWHDALRGHPVSVAALERVVTDLASLRFLLADPSCDTATVQILNTQLAEHT